LYILKLKIELKNEKTKQKPSQKIPQKWHRIFFLENIGYLATYRIITRLSDYRITLLRKFLK